MLNPLETTQWIDGYEWPVGIGLAVAVLAPALLMRAVRRSDKARAAATQPMTDQERAERRDRRGRSIEDGLTLVVAAAAAYLSSTGLRKFGRDIMRLNEPLDWLPFVGLDLAALVCGLRARRRARQGEGPGLSGALFWILIAISAIFSASEADTFMGSVARAAWPLISGVLFELGSLEERLAAKEKLKRELGLWLERKIAAVRMLHPVEWVRVKMALAADEAISQSEATRQVRIERAGFWLYRLRCLQERKKEGHLRIAVSTRLGRADQRAQEAVARVRVTDYRFVLEALQLRVRTSEFATLSYATAGPAERALSNLIGTGDGRTGTGTRPGTPGTQRPGTAAVNGTRTGTAALPVPARPGTATGSGTGTGNTRPGTPHPRPAPVPVQHQVGRDGRPGTAEHPVPPRTGTGEDTRTGQVNAGTGAPGSAGTASDTGTPGMTDAASGAHDQDDRDTISLRVPGAGTDSGDHRDGDVLDQDTTVDDPARERDDLGTDPTGDDDDRDRLDEEDDDLGTDPDGDSPTDEQLKKQLRELLMPDGTFSTGGIGKTARRFGIGSGRAKRLMIEVGGEKRDDETPAQHDRVADEPVVFSVEEGLRQALRIDLTKSPGGTAQRGVDESRTASVP